MCWFTGRVTHYLPFVMAIDIHIQYVSMVVAVS